jgi:hypothetical protein
MTLRQVHATLWEMPQPLGLFAGDLFERGSDYLSAFKELTNAGNLRHRHAESFLLAHAIEVLLKSFLVAKGTPKAALGKSKLKHNLSHILDVCEQRQMPTVNMLRPLCNQLAEINSDFDLRYPTGYNLSLPGPVHTTPIADALVQALGPIVRSACGDALVRHAADTRHLQGAKIRWSD